MHPRLEWHSQSRPRDRYPSTRRLNPKQQRAASSLWAGSVSGRCGVQEADNGNTQHVPDPVGVEAIWTDWDVRYRFASGVVPEKGARFWASIAFLHPTLFSENVAG